MLSIESRLATELAAGAQQISAAIALLDAGSTVPFIARYRKEATGGLDDAQLRTLEERLSYLRELEERRASILKSIAEQGKLTQPLQAAIEAVRYANAAGALATTVLGAEPAMPRAQAVEQLVAEIGQ